MGCTPSKSKATYTHDKVWRDLDTCSTLVSGLKSSVSTPERPSPRPCFEDPSMKQNFLNGQEYPAVVEFAPFQKVSKKKLKKKDTKSGSIEEDPEYKKFLESYCGDEEKATANPETLLGEIEAKTRELIAKRTTPLLEYIKNKKLEKQLLKKPYKDDEQDLGKLKEKGDCGDIEKGKWDKNMKSKQLDTVTKDQKEKVQTEIDKEQREHGRRLREKDHDRPRCREDERKRQRHHYEFDKFMRRKEETKWGKGYCHDRAKKDIHNSYSYCLDGDKLGKEDRGDDLKDRIRNKDRPAMQLYQPGARSRTRLGSGGKSYDSSSKSPDRIVDRRFEAATGTGSEKSGEE
ncbi:Regulator of nonsense transcripts 3A [Acipenser ruthenus]|uniref:Regulator of nonsense transcripts 3A n=1 Tax=Acipenser ruthenus TaxID=7906 RepID=A0A444UFB8_ACIRT|nr:Regulator of nonsense transcripts 3A [Acipenser ruthenus]